MVQTIKQRYYDFIDKIFFNCKLFDIFNNSWSSIDLKQNEIQITQDYLKDGIMFLNKKLSPILTFAGFQTHFAGSFIHGQPIIIERTA